MNRRHMGAALTVISLAIAVLSACGGGGSSEAADASAASVKVSTYITDNLATEYSQVWAGVQKITAINAATGAELTLFESDTAKVFNLASLASVGQLMSSVSIPAGIYSRVKVTLDDKLQLVSLDGRTTTNASFKGDGAPVTFPVSVDFDTSASAQWVLDFNLARFTYDAASGRVQPSIEKRGKEVIKQFMREQAEARGAVVSVAADGFVMNDKHFGDAVVVKLAADGVIFDQASHKVVTLADLKAGGVVEVKGKATPGASAGQALTITAAVVRVVDTAAEARPVAPKFVGGEGTITAVNGGVITLALSDANFLPGSQGNSISVNTANAVYTHGAATDLVVGTEVGFRGNVNTSGGLDALFVDVEGAPSKNDRDGHPERRFADLSAVVISVAGNILTFSANPGEGDRNSSSRTYTADISKAEFKVFGSHCLAVGQRLRIKGSLAGTAMVALVVEVVGGCLDAPK